ncbi:glycosyl transferase [Histidinibacterium aquaticum]|uniref:glycosyl transferase n=1 Tax=Histidinibacterium aquaticum TaxID=2613962 RepID=UPI001CC61FEB|nr:glycosyl transferase [Histidinibacterium aquaticum]
MQDRQLTTAGDGHLLQSLIWPEQGLCTERALYLHSWGGVGLSEEDRRLEFGGGGRVRFDTWFNLFALGKWRNRTGLESLSLQLAGEGRFEVCLLETRPRGPVSPVRTEVVTLSESDPATLDLDALLPGPVDDRRILALQLTALGPARLEAADWLTAQAPLRDPELVVSVTTFRREAAATRTAERFQAWIETHPELKDRIRMQIVDNGQSLDLPPSDTVTVIPSENLGGAGGFARGLLEAREQGASHCLFMDDDASVHMEALERTRTFLAYATDPATAVAGAMITVDQPWRLWENGALFDGRCIPQHLAADLRRFSEVREIEFDAAGPNPPNFYGGWWYFAFPLEAVRHLPFPFFVRGDDVSFALAHDFAPVTLNGVASFQDGFTGKESPLTWYLDLRSHLAHHLSLPKMDRGRLRLLKIPVWFWARNVIRMHYETLSAINLAVEDVMRGPDWFAANADMSQRRADLAALRREEAWAPMDGPLPPERERFSPWNPVIRWLMKLTVNGHLLPGFARIGNRITMTSEARSRIRWVWGAAEITTVNPESGQSYTVRHSKRAAFREGWRLLRNLLRLNRHYSGLKSDWQAAYPRLTSEAFWQKALELEPRAASLSKTPESPSRAVRSA